MNPDWELKQNWNSDLALLLTIFLAASAVTASDQISPSQPAPQQVLRPYTINPGDDIEVYCDKHGGRNRYQALLTFVFDEEWFAIEIESRACSRYTAKWAGHSMQIQFKVDGD